MQDGMAQMHATIAASHCQNSDQQEHSNQQVLPVEAKLQQSGQLFPPGKTSRPLGASTSGLSRRAI